MPENLVVHGVLVALFGKGILLTGEPGSGKSECALHLLDRGHRFIADDAPLFCQTPEKIMGYYSSSFPYLLEVRGLGIIDVQQLYGTGAVLAEHPLDLIINLHTTIDNAQLQERPLQPKLDNKLILGVAIPHFTLHLALSKNVAILIETAVKLIFMQKLSV